MKITLLTFGHKLEPFEEKWVDVYRSRLQRYVKIDWIRLDSKKERTEEDLCKEIEKKTSANAQIVLLDAGGKTWSTEEFKTWIDKQENQSQKEICFVIGSAYGFSKEMLAHFPFHLSLSKFTFSHKLALLILFEQIYRVYSWKAGTPYHHE